MTLKIVNPETGRHICAKGATAKRLFAKSGLASFDDFCRRYQVAPKTAATISVIFKVTSDFVHVSLVSQADDFEVYYDVVTNDIDVINSFINEGYNDEVDKAVQNSLQDVAKYDSVMKEMNSIKTLMMKHNIVNDAFLQELVALRVPAPLKGILCGNKFNAVIFDIITNLLKRYKNRFVCTREVSVPYLSEKLDFMIEDKKTNRQLLGYNQLDLWRGGHQLNRGDKYILCDDINNKLPTNVKLICVINNHTRVTSTDNKKYKILKKGIDAQRLAYPNHLPEIITSYFDIQ